MGVTVSAEQILLLFNPSFVLRISADELGGTVLHEVHHVLLGHLAADPAEFEDEWARTVAEEITVNEFIREALPDGVITLANFPMLPPMESTKQRYNRLKKTRKRKPLLTPQDAMFPGLDGKITPPEKCPTPNRSKSNHKKKRPDPPHKPVLGHVLDDHNLWKDAAAYPQQSKAIIREVIEQAVSNVGPAQVPHELKPSIQSAAPGTMGAQEFCEIQGQRSGKLDWRRLLRHYLGHALELRPVFNRAPRRFPELIGVIPGRGRQPSKPRVMAVVDTSGSITDNLLEQITGELARLAKQFTVIVVECDAAIRRVYNYRPMKTLQGRGGTDFRPPFHHAFLRKHRPDLVIVFTDGDGPAPVSAPNAPVLWSLVPGGKRPATWGKVVWMGNPEVDERPGI